MTLLRLLGWSGVLGWSRLPGPVGPVRRAHLVRLTRLVALTRPRVSRP